MPPDSTSAGGIASLAFRRRSARHGDGSTLRRTFSHLGLPVQVENDASAAAVAELVQGVGTQYEDFLHISLTTFIGAGLVLV